MYAQMVKSENTDTGPELDSFKRALTRVKRLNQRIGCQRAIAEH